MKYVNINAAFENKIRLLLLPPMKKRKRKKKRKKERNSLWDSNPLSQTNTLSL